MQLERLSSFSASSKSAKKTQLGEFISFMYIIDLRLVFPSKPK